MNHFSARARNIGLFWIGEFRCAEHAHFRPVLKNGEVDRFPCEVEAQLAADRALRAYMNGRLRRDGETLSPAMSAADALFPTLVRQKGSSRYTKVETVRRRA